MWTKQSEILPDADPECGRADDREYSAFEARVIDTDRAYPLSQTFVTYAILDETSTPLRSLLTFPFPQKQLQQLSKQVRCGDGIC